jgi:hypothetical protein
VYCGKDGRRGKHGRFGMGNDVMKWMHVQKSSCTDVDEKNVHR